MTICQLSHTIVRSAFLNFIVVELMRCYFQLTHAQRMPTAILLLILIMSAKHLYVHFPYTLK